MLADLGLLGDEAQAVEVGVGAARRPRPASCRARRARSTQALAPATASAPAGSSTTRVSSNTSLIAAHISSVSTSTMSSTSSRQRRNVSSPTCFTATPSANRPDLVEHDALPGLQRAGHRVGVDRLHADDLDRRAQPLHVGGDAGDQPAAADRHEDRVDRPGVLAQDLHADRALPGDHVRVVVGMHEREAARAARAAARARRPRRRSRRAAPPPRRAPRPRRP